jgi:hypothetical protein
VIAVVPGEHDPGVGYLTVACVLAVVFGTLRVVWPRPRA